MTIKKATRLIQNTFFDSGIWDHFNFRDGDVVIATPGKSGTTWMQQVVSQLIFSGEERIDVAELSPWLERQGPALRANIKKVEAQEHRRFVKTHLPADALTMSDQAKYIYIVRDGRDVAWSWYNHHKQADRSHPAFAHLEEPIEPVEEYYRHWLGNDGDPWWPFWDNISSWWDLRDEDNVLLIHFSDMKDDLERAIQNIADFLDIDVDDETFARIVEHCSFEYMKQHAELVVPLSGRLWHGGAQSFVNKGTNQRWSESLTLDDSRKYYEHALNELGVECTEWLSQGNSLKDLAILQHLIDEREPQPPSPHI